MLLNVQAHTLPVLQYNLLTLSNWKKRLRLGYLTTHLELVPIASALGATVIENILRSQCEDGGVETLFRWSQMKAS